METRFEFVYQTTLDDVRFTLASFGWQVRYGNIITIALSSLPGLAILFICQLYLFLFASVFVTILLMVRSVALKTDHASLIDEDEMLEANVRIRNGFMEIENGQETMYRSWGAMRGCWIRGQYMLLRVTSILAMAFHKDKLESQVDVGQMAKYIDERIQLARRDDTHIELPKFELTDEAAYRFMQSTIDFIRCRSMISEVRRSKSIIGFTWSLMFYVIPGIGCLLYFYLFPYDSRKIDIIRELAGFAAFLFTLMLSSRVVSRLMNRLSFGRELNNSVDVRIRVGVEGLVVETPYVNSLYRWHRILRVEQLVNGHVAIISRLPAIVAAVPFAAFQSSLEKDRFVLRIQNMIGNTGVLDVPNAVGVREETGNPYQSPRE